MCVSVSCEPVQQIQDIPNVCQRVVNLYNRYRTDLMCVSVSCEPVEQIQDIPNVCVSEL